MIAESILPPAMPGYADVQPQYQFDPAAAQEILADSSYGADLPAIVISTLGYGDEEDTYTIAMANMWQETLGIEYTIEYLVPDEYTKAAAEKHGQIVTWGWCADYPDPENFLDLLFHSGSEFNLTAYSNAEVDTLLEQARIEFDPQRRVDLYQQVEQLLLADIAAIPLKHGVDHMLANPRIEGYVMSPIGVAQVRLWSINTEANEDE